MRDHPKKAREQPPIGPPEEHPPAQALVAYHLGTLPARERDLLRDHLLSCTACLEDWRDARRFLRTAEENAAAPVDPELPNTWKRLLRQLPELTRWLAERR